MLDTGERIVKDCLAGGTRLSFQQIDRLQMRFDNAIQMWAKWLLKYGDHTKVCVSRGKVGSCGCGFVERRDEAKKILTSRV